MTSRRWSRALALALAAVLVATVSACGVTRDGTDPDNRRLRMMIPNSPGGGYDLTGRAAAQTMEQEGLTGRFEINNVIGASGTVAMQRLLNEEGSEDVMLLMGLGVVGAVFTNRSDATVDRATPIAGLVAEAEGILVPADSPFQTLDDLVEAWKADPGSITVGGGSSPGGPDHLFPMQLAQTVGIDPNDVNYISYDGGGPLTTALLGEKIDVGMSGLGEFQGQIDSGELRVLAVSGAERLETVDARRSARGRRHGVPELARCSRTPGDLDRGPSGARGPPDRDARDARVGRGPRAQRMDRQLHGRPGVRGVPHRPERPRRADAEGAGTGMSTDTDITHDTRVPARGKVVDTAQYGLAAFLLVVGVLVLVDASGLEKGFADQPVQPYAFGFVIGTVLVLLSALLAIATWRGDVAEAEDGEDIDLTQGSDWATVAKLGVVFSVVVLTIGWLGWAIVGAFLFVGTARILGSRRLILDIGIGVALSLLTWYGLYVGLGIPIPAGVLDGVL